MKQQVNPAIAIAAVVGVIVVIGLVVFFMNNRSPDAAAPSQPLSQAPGAQGSGAQSAAHPASPDDIVKQHMQQQQPKEYNK